MSLEVLSVILKQNLLGYKITLKQKSAGSAIRL